MPGSIDTPRLFLRRPRAADAETVFARYASDPEVTRYMAWPTHRSLDDTRAFLAFSDAECGRGARTSSTWPPANPATPSPTGSSCRACP